jgi:hypothetical protein
LGLSSSDEEQEDDKTANNSSSGGEYTDEKGTVKFTSFFFLVKELLSRAV